MAWIGALINVRAQNPSLDIDGCSLDVAFFNASAPSGHNAMITQYHALTSNAARDNWINSNATVINRTIRDPGVVGIKTNEALYYDGAYYFTVAVRLVDADGVPGDWSHTAFKASVMNTSSTDSYNPGDANLAQAVFPALGPVPEWVWITVLAQNNAQITYGGSGKVVL